MTLSNDMAALIGFACEASLWGAYTVLFFVSMVLLFRRKERGFGNTPVIILSIVLFLFCTAHFALEFNHFYTILRSIGVNGFANETKPLVGADIFISLCDLLGDFLLVYRCWALWGKKAWVVVLPFLTAVAGVGCMARAVHLTLVISPTAPVPDPSIVPLTTAAFSLPLCTNVMATGLILLRMWLMSRRTVTGLGIHRSKRVACSAVMIIVESGLLYLVTQLVFVVLVAIAHPAQAIVAVMAVQVYGIAPTLIVLHVGIGIAVDTTAQNLPAGSTWASHSAGLATRSDVRVRTGTGIKADGESLEMKTIESQSDFAAAV
ncbi:hypothetical protein OH76DRAFT_277179 [Lentinus brumalis]|uniref:Family A G protein-coupled receptor-like protein n=1 Tax=Lentinus brumalis TaxID=2498619 RepID=A0A371CKZ7_9APHY|nr:hypothetical protein OH76DRAFT_277179 [Polyporus brumalis]